MIVINLGSIVFTYAILIGLGLFGWARGFRYMLSIAIFLTIGYLLTVQGGGFVVGLVNRFWTQMPKLFAFLIGRNPAEVAPFDALIPDTFQAPWLFRVLVFLALLIVGVVKAWPWEGKPLQGFKGGNQSIRILGAVTGVYVAVLGVSAISTFWQDIGGSFDLPDLLRVALDGLPTFGDIIPSIIAAFFVLIFVLILLQFPRVWKP